MYDAMADAALRNGWNPVHISDNVVSESLYGRLLAPTTYERLGVLLLARDLLGDSMFAVDAAAVQDGLRHSHFVALAPPPPPLAHVPFHDSMRHLDSLIREYCESHLVVVGRYRLPDGEVTLYERPHLNMEGVYGDWITSAGLTLVGEPRVLALRPSIELRGPLHLSLLGGRLPRVQASLGEGPSAPALTAELLAAAGSEGREYVLGLRVDPRVVATLPEVRIHLTFDRYFVPAQIGLNEDVRQLVLPRPVDVRLLPQGPDG
jgi:hypothetical protein